MKQFIFLINILSFSSLNAQIAIPASGGNLSNMYGSVSFTIGQIFYSCQQGTNGYRIEGVQQPYEISLIQGSVKVPDINPAFLVYPNPAYDILILKINNFSSENLLYQLLDNSGRLLEQKKIKSTETKLDLKNYAKGLYYLKILHNHKEAKTFKIIKF